MSLRKWNDSKGWARGAKGIDLDKGTEFVWKYVDKTAMARQFDRTWSHASQNEANPAEYSGNTDTKAWSESEDYDAPSKSGPNFPK